MGNTLRGGNRKNKDCSTLINADIIPEKVLKGVDYMGFSDYEVYCPDRNREKLFLTASDLQEILQLGINTTVQKYPI